jgi:DnaK suppressor protein
VTPAERRRVTAALADDRARAEARLVALTRDVDRIVADAVLTPPDDEHDPDGATVGFERAQLSHLRDATAAHLVALDLAEARVVAGTATTCESCGGPLPVERLVARPVTRWCIACAR